MIFEQPLGLPAIEIPVDDDSRRAEDIDESRETSLETLTVSVSSQSDETVEDAWPYLNRQAEMFLMRKSRVVMMRATFLACFVQTQLRLVIPMLFQIFSL